MGGKKKRGTNSERPRGDGMTLRRVRVHPSACHVTVDLNEFCPYGKGMRMCMHSNKDTSIIDLQSTPVRSLAPS